MPNAAESHLAREADKETPSPTCASSTTHTTIRANALLNPRAERPMAICHPQKEKDNQAGCVGTKNNKACKEGGSCARKSGTLVQKQRFVVRGGT